jgi:hypothetical protein
MVASSSRNEQLIVVAGYAAHQQQQKESMAVGALGFPSPQRRNSDGAPTASAPTTAAGAAVAGADADPLAHALRVRRLPLKRSTGSGGLAARAAGAAPRGLSRNYHGRSQSFSCMEDLARGSPWTGHSALALAKRPRASSDSSDQSADTGGDAFAGAARPIHAAPRLAFGPGGSLSAPCSLSSSPRLQPMLPLTWSIGEEDECAPLGAAAGAGSRCASSSGALLAAAAAELLADEELSAGGLRGRWADASVALSRRSWDSACSEGGGCDVRAALGGGGRPSVADELSAALRAARLASAGAGWAVDAAVPME